MAGGLRHRSSAIWALRFLRNTQPIARRPPAPRVGSDGIAKAKSFSRGTLSLVAPTCSDREFIRLVTEQGPAQAARLLGVTQRSVYARRNGLEKRTGHRVDGPTARRPVDAKHSARLHLEVGTGIVLIASDGHYWPGEATPAHRAFVQFTKELKPSLVVMNGDAFDGSRISRHAPIGWENRPEVIEELEAVQERLNEIETAAPRKSRLVWPLGNHDARFESRLSLQAPEFARVHGMHLKDHMGPKWEPCWSCWINNSVVVKHSYKGGMHAAHNNTLWAGKTIVTGHTHALKVAPLPDYNGVRWGIETGCLAYPYGPQFADYTEDNPRLWQSGFAVLTFHKGQLLQPELVRVFDNDHVDFRGALIRV